MPFHIHRATCWALTCCLSGLLAAPQALADDPASQQLRDQQRGLRQLEQQQRLERWQRQPAPAESHDATAPPPTSAAGPSPAYAWPATASFPTRR